MAILEKIQEALPATFKERLVWFGLLYVVGILIYWTGLAIYNLTLHPLAEYPGPFLCRAGWLYQMYYEAILSGRMLERLPALHRKYGEFSLLPRRPSS